MNYYNLFDIQEAPLVDTQFISAKYISLQKKYHPDFFTTDTEDAQEDALEQSAHINKAYNIFRNKDKTLEYFLQQKGIIVADEKFNLPPDFLMEMMELNESIDEKETISEKIEDFERALEDEVKPLLMIDSAASLTEKDLQILKANYYKKKYLHRILERLDD
jgi:molecular chaperone HscB